MFGEGLGGHAAGDKESGSSENSRWDERGGDAVCW